jgi:hypothetical protein
LSDRDVRGVDGHADGGDLKVVADPGQHPPAVLGCYRFRRHGAADEVATSAYPSLHAALQRHVATETVSATRDHEPMTAA